MRTSLKAWFRWKRILLALGLLLASAVVLVGAHLYRAVYVVMPECYATECTKDLLLAYLEKHPNRWPKSWDDLISVTNTDGSPLRVPLTSLQALKIDWAPDLMQLRQLALRDTNVSAQVVTRLDGSQLFVCWGKDSDPNWALMEYLRRTPPTLGDEAPIVRSVAEIAAGYTNFQQITHATVEVNPELAMLCVGTSKEQVETARKRFGPHANTGIRIYMDDLAATAFRSHAAQFPVGAVVVKQKTIHGYQDTTDKKLHDEGNGVGGMVKRAPGYNPEHGDWEYFYFETGAQPESGRIASCVQCHDSAKGTDFVFGTWNKSE